MGHVRRLTCPDMLLMLTCCHPQHPTSSAGRPVSSGGRRPPCADGAAQRDHLLGTGSGLGLVLMENAREF
eukprot:scaffold57945_cov48-Phaeocystis_antarctica.AAC.2